MPSYAWSHSAALSFSNLTDVYCVFDSGVQGSVTSLEAEWLTIAAFQTTTFGIYAHYFAAGDTPPIDGTGYLTPPVTPDPVARCLETPGYGSGHWPDPSGVCADPAGPHERVQVYVYPRGGGGSSFPKRFEISINGAWTGSFGSGYCAYGTRVKAGAQTVGIITAAAVQLLFLRRPDARLFSIIFDSLIGLAWVPGVICGDFAPQLPVWTSSDFIFGTGIPSPTGIEKGMQTWYALQWPTVCECVSAVGGDPPAVDPPDVYVPPSDPNLPVVPDPVTCDQNALCDMLNQLSRQLGGIQTQLTIVRNDVTVIQRQGVPFGYILGTVHSGLSGQGQFAVADILGLAVTFNTLPGTITPIAGDPLTYHQVGKISTGTVDGWTRSWQPTHSPYLILPVSGAFTLVGWTFVPGVVATITELVREP